MKPAFRMYDEHGRSEEVISFVPAGAGSYIIPDIFTILHSIPLDAIPIA